VASITSKRARARAQKQRRRSPLLTIAGVALAAFAVVGALIGLQTSGGDSATIPERVATGEGRVLGDPDAPVTVIEYADFQCPVCKRAESSILAHIERDYVLDGRVKIEFRMYPFLGPESWHAAQAAEAAQEQGKFWEYHDALFNAQERENSGAFSHDRLVELAREVALDVPRFEATLGANTYLEPLRDEAQAARDAGVESTPTFFVNGEKIAGAQPYGEFQQAIDAALRDAGVTP
jgi:protein-disulfide isomerase